tara:strand:- start:28 stop:552 length:525 start_codon:yes stop_codon:yes gene_type:complete
MKTILLLISLSFTSPIYCFSLYKLTDFLTIHKREPFLFREPLEKLKKSFHIPEDFDENESKKQIYKEYMKDKKIYFVDIDNTICRTIKSDYVNSIPKHNIIHKLNQLYYEGNEIHYFTSRGQVSGKYWNHYTKNQLQFWNVKYNTLNMRKPHYDYWIDDKAIHIDDFEKTLIQD